MRPRDLRILFGVLAVFLAASVGLNVWLLREIFLTGGWRDEVFVHAGFSGTRWAMDDYRAGHLRIYVLDEKSKDRHFTGEMDGPFEIWSLFVFPSLGNAHRYAQEQIVESYNDKMRYMHAHPDKFPRPKAAPANEGRGGEGAARRRGE